MKRILVLFLALLLALFVPCLAEEEEKITEKPEIDSRYGIVYNVETGKVLFDKGSNSIIYPASLVKIMTGILACEYYEAEGGDLTVTVTESALEGVQGNKIGLKPGEEVPFYDLIVATLIGSGNDAAYVIAETVGGSVEGFVSMMNKRAEEIGALHTSYANPSGFHSPYMLTTLFDQALICTEASASKLLLDITSMISYEMPATNMAKKRTFTNQNLLFDYNHWLRHYTPNTRGLNVGMTNEAGWCMATVFDNDGLTNIVIVSGGNVKSYDYIYMNDVKKMMKYSADGFAFFEVLPKSEVLHDVKVSLGNDKDRMILVSKDKITALLPVGVDIENDVVLESSLKGEVFEAPIRAGEVFGSVSAYYGGEFLGESALVATTNVEQSTSLLVFDRIGRFFSNAYVKSILIFLSSVIFLLLTFVFIKVSVKRRRLRDARLRRAHSVGHARKEVKK